MSHSAAFELPATASIAEFCAGDISGDRGDLLRRASLAFADTIGVALAAKDEESAKLMRAWAGDTFSRQGRTAFVLGSEMRFAPSGAALVNGTLAHALDFDDVTHVMKGHPSAVLVSTILALGDAYGRSGREALEAYLVGLDVACAVAAGVSIADHYSRGWHATATIGVMGAAAAGARLLRLNKTETRRALGIAASLAAGSRANFGSMTKHLHVGKAASNAVTAVELAVSGFTATENMLEATSGYLDLFGGSASAADAVVAALPSEIGSFVRTLNVKKYPCCYQAHRAVDSIIRIREQVSDPGLVRRISAAVHPGGGISLIHHQPYNATTAKFSAEYLLAVALVDGHIGMNSFSDECRLRPAVASLMPAVEMRESPVPSIGESHWVDGYAVVQVQLGDGSVFTERTDIPRGHWQDPLSAQELENKFIECARYGGAFANNEGAAYLDCMNIQEVAEIGDLQVAKHAGREARTAAV